MGDKLVGRRLQYGDERRPLLTPTQFPVPNFALGSTHKTKAPLFKAPVPQALAPPMGGFGERGGYDGGRLVEGRWRGARAVDGLKKPRRDGRGNDAAM